MAEPGTDSTTSTGLRLWPGVVLVSLQWLGRFVMPALWPETMMYAVMAGALGGPLVILWWLLASRAAWIERLGVLALIGLAFYATPLLLHESVATAGQGILFYLEAMPFLSLALVAAAALAREQPAVRRRVALAAAIVVSIGGWALLRTEGVTGGFTGQYAWRWSATAEEQLLAAAAPLDLAAIDRGALVGVESAWPGFRGPRRDSVVRSAPRIATDWEASPPVELWRRPVGPGWSSFAVAGELIFTQEQRGDAELVSAYRLADGEPVWRHRDATRFWESNGGAGPRGTPTYSDARVYAFGATGILNALDAATGATLWSRDVGADAEVRVPFWGFASSPLVMGDRVIVAAAGRLVAYGAVDGVPRWLGSDGGGGYSSPHRLVAAGVEQVLLASGSGISSFDPVDGTPLWDHDWRGSPMVQPTLLDDGDLLVSTGGDAGALGMRRLSIAQAAGQWRAQSHWTSIRLKPYFNGFVVHEGHAYGFDGSILACMGIDDGERCWKGGRYGHGQLVLLPEQDLLLVVTEDGDLALVRATPDEFAELARVEALAGKTWNHPALVNDVLLVRNGAEMAAFRLVQDPVR